MKKYLQFGVVAVLTILCLSAISFSQEKVVEQYKQVVGTYEFDIPDMGLLSVEFYLEDDVIMALSDQSTEADALEPVEDEKTLVFEIVDDDEGRWEVRFLKDDNGKYTKCRIINEFMAIDVTGSKND